MVYGLIGKSLRHSFSAEFFNKKFIQEKRDDIYRLFELPDLSIFPALLDENPEIRGLNVTIPYKEEIIPYLDSLSEEAEKIGAVNTIKFIKRDGKLLKEGHNTDAPAFKQTIEPLIHEGMTRALVLGTGGASRAVDYALRQLDIEVIKVSRKPQKEEIDYSQITKDLLKKAPIIINTTPVGMFPEIDAAPHFPFHWLTPDHLCYDLIYNPEETLFMKKSAAMGTSIKNGLEMLHTQALLAWDIWQS